MSLWGKGDGGEPNWLTTEQKASTFATPAGWVYRQPNGTQELLVAMRAAPTPLPTAMGAPDVTAVFFSNTASAYVRNNANGFVTVNFNERVVVTGSPTLAITGSAANAVATFVSGSNSNRLLFQFTVPNTANNTLSIGAQTIALAGGTIVDSANNTLNANRVFVANNVLGVQGKGSTKTVVVA